MKTLKERFYAKTSVGDTGQCWLWNGSMSHNGYGFFTIKKLMGAHRASWILHNGEIPEGMWILHRCDNKRCVNPTHLFLGTPKDNQDDMHQKGREFNPKGEELPQSKLTADAVIEIRRRYAAGELQKDIGADFGVKQPTISDAINGKNWAHIKVPTF